MSSVPAPIVATRPNIDPLDTCDRHPASRPKWAALLPGHEHPLLFCGHCWTQHAIRVMEANAKFWNLTED